MLAAPVQPAAGEVATGDVKWRYFRIAIALAVVYCAVHIIARMLASPNLGEDDPVTNVFVQTLQPGYSVERPPLFEWLVWAVQRVTGPSLLGFQLVKYGLLVATIGALYLCAYQITRDGVWSVVTAEALTLIYHVGWRFHEGFTGLIPAMLFSVLSLYFVLKIFERGRSVDFALLGGALGLGLLSEHSFALCALGLFIACAIERHTRVRFYRSGLALTVIVAGAVVAPYYAWLLSDAGRVAKFLTIEPIFTNPHPKLDFWKVVRKTVGAPFLFFWSLLLFLLFAAWRRIVAHFRVRLLPEINWAQLPLHRFLAWYTVVAIVLLFVSGLAFSYVRYAYHDLLSLLLPTLLLLFALIYEVRPGPAEIQRWARISLAIIVFAFVARAANMFVMEPFCKICRWGIPYEQLARTLAERGFDGGTIVTFEPDLAGNLRMYLPGSEVRVVNWRRFKVREAQPGSDAAKGIAVVWQLGGRQGLQASREEISERLQKAGIAVAPTELRAAWSHLYRPTGYRHTVWQYVILGDVRLAGETQRLASIAAR